MNPEMHNLIVQLAGWLHVDWHDRQNRVIFTTNDRQPRRVYMFRINSRDGLIRVFINDLVLDSAEFNAAVDRVSLISRAGDYNVIKMEFANGQLHITSNNPDIGNAEETIPASIEGPEVTIAFNAQYLTDVMKIIDSKNCELRLTKPLSPMTVKEEKDDAFIYVVTPVRTAH